MSKYVQEVLANLGKKYPWEKEFLQAAQEVLESLALVVERDDKYKKNRILERIVEPERVLIFRVPWLDDKGEAQVNTGFRVQYSSVLGPRCRRTGNWVSFWPIQATAQ